jgi:hypothetical protein
LMVRSAALAAPTDIIVRISKVRLLSFTMVELSSYYSRSDI